MSIAARIVTRAVVKNAIAQVHACKATTATHRIQMDCVHSLDWRSKSDNIHAKLERLEFELENAPPLETETEKRLTFLMAVIIFASIIVMGLELDMLSDDTALVFFWAELLFCIAFSIEIIVRMYWERKAWVRSGWNWLDLFLVCVSAISTFTPAGEEGLRIVNMLRIIRLSRLIRLIKLVKSFRALYVVLMSWWHALQGIVHVYLILAIGIYFYALLATQFIGKSETLRNLSLGDKKADEVFGTVIMSMYSLFQLMTLEGFAATTYPIVQESPIFLLYFASFVLVFTFGLLNMLVGLVVEKTLSEAARLREHGDEETQRKTALRVSAIEQLFDSCPKHDNRSMTEEEFLHFAETNHDMSDQLQAIGVPIIDSGDLFNLLDLDGDGTIDKPEFVAGVVKLYGVSATGIETRAAHAGIRRLRKEVASLQRLVCGDWTRLEQAKTSRLPLQSLCPFVVQGQRGSENLREQAKLTGKGMEIPEPSCVKARPKSTSSSASSVPTEGVGRHLSRDDKLQESVSRTLKSTDVPLHLELQQRSDDALVEQLRALESDLKDKISSSLTALRNQQLAAVQQQSLALCEGIQTMVAEMNQHQQQFQLAMNNSSAVRVTNHSALSSAALPTGEWIERERKPTSRMINL